MGPLTPVAANIASLYTPREKKALILIAASSITAIIGAAIGYSQQSLRLRVLTHDLRVSKPKAQTVRNHNFDNDFARYDFARYDRPSVLYGALVGAVLPAIVLGGQATGMAGYEVGKLGVSKSGKLLAAIWQFSLQQFRTHKGRTIGIAVALVALAYWLKPKSRDRSSRYLY